MSKLTKEALAAMLNGRQYSHEITKEEQAQAKAANLVVVFGASDDLMEFRGAINNEAYADNGKEVAVIKTGLLDNECEDSGCPYFKKITNTATTITAHWDKDGFSWCYTTAIPHATFVINDDTDPYCQGIVFSADDVPAEPSPWLPIPDDLPHGERYLVSVETDEGPRVHELFLDDSGQWIFDGEPTFCLPILFEPYAYQPLPKAAPLPAREED